MPMIAIIGLGVPTRCDEGPDWPLRPGDSMFVAVVWHDHAQALHDHLPSFLLLLLLQPTGPAAAAMTVA